MNKIAQYLNEHVLGEIVTNDAIREQFSRDGSILSLKPEIVAHPRTTNDIRKIARFTWQLAEKGHVIPITVRGGGTDRTGGAIGKGIIINTSAHLNKILFISPKPKDQFAHVQTGVNVGLLESVLQSKGLALPVVPTSADYCTVGGSLANNASGLSSGKNGLIGSWVNRLEVVLANGDIIETSRISKHDLNKKKGLETFEGEIYRKIDGLLEDNAQLIESQLDSNENENIGYHGISQVKKKDGSLDLTPLIVGCQGTLGIISEAAIQTVFSSDSKTVMIATFNNSEKARDVADNIAKEAEPSQLELFDGKLFEIALKYGKKYIFNTDDSSVKSVLHIVFDDITDHKQKKGLKKALKILSKANADIYSDQDYPSEDLEAIREVGSFISQAAEKDFSLPQILSGSAIPTERREEFLESVEELAKNSSVDLPMQFQWLSGIVHVYPTMQMHLISDKQKALKLIKEYTKIVTQYDGTIAAESGEGRLKTLGAYENIDSELLDLYAKVREVFDPYGTLNPGVKQKTDIKTLASSLDSHYSLADLAKYSPHD